MSIYCWGLSKHGQAGKGDKNGKVIIPMKVGINISHGKVIDLSAGGLYTAAITDKNSIISFGCGKYGRLGNGSEADQTSPFIYTVNGDVLKSISCGLWHGCVLHANGNVSIWGYKKACGSTSGNTLEPCVVADLNNCIGVSSGNNYTLTWTKEGHAYSWGSNHHGVLGHGNNEPTEKPFQIAALKDVKVIHMSAGFSHCGAVTEDGKVYMWGKGKFGALGLGEEKQDDYLVPQLVPDLVDMKEISCNVGENHGHTLALSHDGTVYSSGDGYKGKLGLGNQNSYWSFQSIPHESFCGESVIHVSAGGIHSSAVSKEGHVFTWGCGSDGRLGHPDAEGHRYLFRSDSPRIVETLQGKSVNVSSSYYHTVALLEN